LNGTKQKGVRWWFDPVLVIQTMNQPQAPGVGPGGLGAMPSAAAGDIGATGQLVAVADKPSAPVS